jgi:hypothetical protein
MAKMANTTEVIDRKREELDVAGVEGGNDINTHGIIAVAAELYLCFLIVPVISVNHIGLDTRRSRGRFCDDDIGRRQQS